MAIARVKKIGNYEVSGEIGRGGMAVVYKGLQASLNRPIAIKLLSQKVAQNKEIVERFNRESLIIARLTHPNIIHVIDRGITEEGRPFFIMDLVEGTTLSKLLKGDPVSPRKKFDLIIQVCKGLSYAHKNGVIHRDIKPANILIDKEENAILTDFGIAQFFNQETGEDELTKEGMILGTLSYMSPEQKCGSRDISAESDLYSLGVIMYEMLTGSKPKGKFKHPSELVPTIPKFIDEVILKCLAEEPSDRFRSADEVKDQLLKFLRGGHLQDKKKKEALKGTHNLKERFVLLDVIEENRFGAINLMQDKEDDHLMVVKRCKPSRDWSSDKRLLTNLKHKNIAKVLGSSQDRYYCNIVMEYVSGGSLKDRMVKEHPLPKVLSTAKGICEGLAYAHMQGLIHGNIRPSNILIDESGTEKIADFGLKEHYQGDDRNINWYSPPHEERSYQADIYGVGVILYEMLLGTRPVWRQGIVAPHEAFKAFPIDLQEMILKMINRKREKRYRNLDDIIRTIDALLEAQNPIPMYEVEKEVEEEKVAVGSSRRMFLLFVLFVLFAVFYYFQFGNGMMVLLETEIKNLFETFL